MLRASAPLLALAWVLGCSSPRPPPVEPPRTLEPRTLEPPLPTQAPAPAPEARSEPRDPLTRCAPDYGFEDRPQLCTELSRHELSLGARTYLIVWRQRDYEAQWGEQSAAFPLGHEVLVLVRGATGTTLVDAAFVENLSGAGFRDVLQVEPLAEGEAPRHTATITIWCRGFYADPDDEGSYVEPGECGQTRVVIELDAEGAEVRITP